MAEYPTTNVQGQTKVKEPSDRRAFGSLRIVASFVRDPLSLVLGFRSHVLRRNPVAMMFALMLACASAARADDALLDRWFAEQAAIKTWSANFTQTRTLKALKEPLKAEGRVWFASPNQFRWELGDPAQTIAVRETNKLVILYPRLKRAERYPLDEQSAGPWRDALTLLEAGFPRSRDVMDKQFKVKSLEERGDVAELTLQPRSARARKLITEIQLTFGREDLLLRATELRFADGSTLRNDFRDSKINPPLDADLFALAIPDDFKVTEPLSRTR